DQRRAFGSVGPAPGAWGRRGSSCAATPPLGLHLRWRFGVGTFLICASCSDSSRERSFTLVMQDIVRVRALCGVHKCSCVPAQRDRVHPCLYPLASAVAFLHGETRGGTTDGHGWIVIERRAALSAWIGVLRT